MTDNPLDDLPRIHPRERVVQAAEAKLAEALEDLTDAEAISILGAHLSRIAKYAIRVERHGDAGKPGGVE